MSTPTAPTAEAIRAAVPRASASFLRLNGIPLATQPRLAGEMTCEGPHKQSAGEFVPPSPPARMVKKRITVTKPNPYVTNPPHSSSPASLVECDLRLGPLAARQAQGSDTARFLIRVTSFRRRLLDEDNLCEKYVVDCCRYAGFIPDDAPGATHIETRQEKVGSKAEERTEISIEDLSHGRSL